MLEQTRAGRSASLSVWPLSVVALLAVYGSVLVGEFVSGSGVTAYLLGGLDLPVTVLRIVVLTVTTLPVAYVAGYELARRAPMFGLKAVTVAALLWSALIAVLQLTLYEPNVVVASVLKMLFVVVPLLVGGTIARRTVANHSHAP